ncbi:MAG: histidinol phosphate phosphatase domain-containing protein [Chloroflexi bacterium]|nr:histidinol phosphate phosphatase domain-containing protein [Chloroflexota bacterium]
MKLKRIDLHMHSLFSDGCLLPSELLRHAGVHGYRAAAITDHADSSNLPFLLSNLHAFLEAQGSTFETQLLIGVELTHVAPVSIAPLARCAKELGADLVVVHGETIVEPVAPGTNRAAVECADVDLLAHPGLLTDEEAALAAARGCLIEVSSRKGHSLTNGHVVQVCRRAGAFMVIDTDTHHPDDMISLERAKVIALAAGMHEAEILAATETTPSAFLERCLANRTR